MKFCATILFFLSAVFSQVIAQTAPSDAQLARYVRMFKLSSVEKLKGKNPHLFKAGQVLFSDNILSGNRNISCKDCHHPEKGSADGIALSLGEGSINSDIDRRQGAALLIKRHSPVLYNLGHPEFKRRMFWDGRIFMAQNGFHTPEERFNGRNPQALHIVKFFDHALDAQVIFPILSHEEMRGAPGSNPVASETDNLKAWQMIFERIKTERKEVIALLKKAYPNLEDQEFNIAHVGKALSEFIKHEFQVRETPYDRYLRGDLGALDTQAKRGLKLFLTKARCANCHFGKHLTNHNFANIGVPPLSEKGSALDEGRFEWTGHGPHRFQFKTPGLRNVSKSAPYMHNGVFADLEEVLQHYNSVELSLKEFLPRSDTHLPYREELERLDDQLILQQIFENIFHPFLRKPLGLTKQEIQDLKYFLEIGLTQD